MSNISKRITYFTSCILTFLITIILYSENYWEDSEFYFYSILQNIDHLINAEEQDNRIVIYQILDKNNEISQNYLTELINKIGIYEPAVIGVSSKEIPNSDQILDKKILEQFLDEGKLDKSLYDGILDQFLDEGILDKSLKKKAQDTARKLVDKKVFPYLVTSINKITNAANHQPIIKSAFINTAVGDILYDDLTSTNARISLLLHRDIPEENSTFHFSLAVKLSDYFLGNNYLKENGIFDEFSIRYRNKIDKKSVEIPRLEKNPGIYQNSFEELGITVSTLINYRCPNISIVDIFRIKECSDAFQEKQIDISKEHDFSDDEIKNKIVIIGFVSNTSSANEALTHAHATSQIISSILDDRKLYKTYSFESLCIILIFVLILSFAVIGSDSIPIFNKLIRLSILSLSTNLIVIFAFVIYGYWLSIPLLNFLIILVFIFSVLIRISSIWKDEKKLLQDQKILENIELAYGKIHTKPLQDMFLLIREVQNNRNMEVDYIAQKLSNIDQSIRTIFADLISESDHNNDKRYLILDDKLIRSLDKTRIHALLRAVFSNTIKRESNLFQNIQPNLSFQPFDDSKFNHQSKYIISQLFEDAIINVGRYATEATYIDAEGFISKDQSKYIIQIKDNGKGFQDNVSKIKKDMIRHRLRLINADIFLENNIDKDKIIGAKITIEFSINQKDNNIKLLNKAIKKVIENSWK